MLILFAADRIFAKQGGHDGEAVDLLRRFDARQFRKRVDRGQGGGRFRGGGAPL
jgi:hypothetical protein